ncbi:Efflux ABC transporter, ATP-binding protein [hydrothermal vent metagenome]|uniref:Efflux ABC transporter, ATP-binding protein n=1 Tax=hydrothermal vent metagenome TaxID=652676 RepID=A0A3B1CHH3_9ZZZZ
MKNSAAGDKDRTVLSVEGLVKKYGKKKALQGVSFKIAGGDFLGLLGPNGAGKTTTIKILTGLTKLTEGGVYYYGKDFSSHPGEAKRFIGMVPQQSNLDRDLTAFQNLYLHTILHGIPKALRMEKIDEALEFAGLMEYRNRQVKTFSGGMRRRLVIVRALLHEPRILFLDEPTVGLDPQIRRTLWELILKVNQVKGTAILLTTHYIEEAERLCDRVLIINRGRIIAEGPPDDLKKDIGGYVLEIFLEDRIEEHFFSTREEALESLKGCDHSCKVREVTLEDVFLKLTGRRINV